MFSAYTLARGVPMQLLSVAFVAASLLVFTAAPTAVAQSKPSATCPVDLSAQQRPAGELVPTIQVVSDEPSRPAFPFTQAFNFTMKNRRLARIVAIELEVHGTVGVPRVSPAASAGAVLHLDQPGEDTVRSVHLASSVPAEQQRTRVVAVHQLTSISYVSITELRYADGSTWYSGPGRECRVIPDPSMLIANKQ